MPDFVESLRNIEKIPLTYSGGLQSNDLWISWVIGSSCEIQESFISISLVRFCVLQQRLGSVLEFTTGEHCEAKMLLKRLAFVVKSETTKLLSTFIETSLKLVPFH